MNWPPRIFRARHLCPVTRPVIDDGFLAVADGRIVDLGPWGERLGGPTEDLGEVTLLPALVNAHTHLVLSHLVRDDQPPQPYTDWLAAIATRLGRGHPDFAQRATAAQDAGVEQCRRFGVVAVGDIALPGLPAPSGLGGVRFVEALGLGAGRGRFEAVLRWLADAPVEEADWRIGLSPHSPYTVDPEGLRESARLALAQRRRLAIHLAEWPEEEPFLSGHTGPLADLYRRLGVDLGGVERFDGSPVALADSCGLLRPGTLLVHCNYLSDVDVDRIARSGCSVAYCPRTHAWFGHGQHRWRELLARGVNVCLGTDSCASSPDLDVRAEARLLQDQGADPMALLQMITINAARALGLENELGSLETGKRAAVLAVHGGPANLFAGGSVRWVGQAG